MTSIQTKNNLNLRVDITTLELTLVLIYLNLYRPRALREIQTGQEPIRTQEVSLPYTVDCR